MPRSGRPRKSSSSRSSSSSSTSSRRPDSNPKRLSLDSATGPVSTSTRPNAIPRGSGQQAMSIPMPPPPSLYFSVMTAADGAGGGSSSNSNNHGAKKKTSVSNPSSPRPSPGLSSTPTSSWLPSGRPSPHDWTRSTKQFGQGFPQPHSDPSTPSGLASLFLSPTAPSTTNLSSLFHKNNSNNNQNNSIPNTSMNTTNPNPNPNPNRIPRSTAFPSSATSSPPLLSNPTPPLGSKLGSNGSSPRLYNHYHTLQHPPASTYPLSVTHSRRSSLSHTPSMATSHGATHGSPPTQSQRHGFFDMSIFDPNSDRIKSARSSIDHDGLSHRRTASRAPSIESINSTNSVPFAPPPPPPPSAWKRFTSHFSKRVIKRHIKFLVAFYLAALLTLIPSVAQQLGPSPYLANIAVIFMHPSRTVGSMLEIAVFCAVGGILGAIWVLPCQAIIASYNRSHPPAGDNAAWAIDAAWFFVGMWLITIAKTRYAKLNGSFVIYSILGIFSLTKNHLEVEFRLSDFGHLLGPLMLGIAICVFVCIVFWPETASEGLGRALNESLDTSRALLNLSTRFFLLNHKTIALPKSALEKAQAEVRTAQKKLYSAYREARYEVTYSVTNPADYKEVRVILSALMRHLASMSLVVQNERLLMLGHPDRDDEDLFTQSEGGSWHETETDTETSDTDSEECCSGCESDGASSSRRSSSEPTSRFNSGEQINRQQDYFGDATAADALRHSTTDPSSSSTQHKHHRRQCKHTHHKTPAPSPSSEYGPHPRRRVQRRGSAAELRRIRQLLQRAENSTEAALRARKKQQDQDQERQQKEKEDWANPFLYDRGGTATAPSTPGGRDYKNFFTPHYSSSRNRSLLMTRADGSLGVDGHSDGSRPVTPLGSRQATPVSSRANSIHEERNSETVKSFKSLFSVKSSPRFKPKRTISLRAETKFGKGVKDSDDDPVGSPSAGVSYEELNAMTVPLPLRGDMLDHSLSHHRTHGGVRFGTPLTDQQVRKAAEAFRKQREKEVRRAHKRARREAKEEEDRIRKQQQAEEAARAVPPKEVAFGDRKLFISFLDIVRDPLQRLNDSCSRVMLAMERELVEGLNVEQDRLERIQRRNAQRTAAIRAAEATRLAEENKAAHATNAGAGCASTTATAAGEAADGAHGAAAAEPAKSKQLLDRLRGLMNLKSRHMSPEDIEYAEALKNDMEHEEKKKSKATKRGAMADTIHPNKFQQQTQRNAKSSGIDADDDDMALPLEMSYVQYLTQELEAFDKAEAKGLRDFISTHPTLDVGPREEIFLIFFFLFALREIARELLRLGKYMEEKQEDARRELEEKGSTKRSKRLWWPKVMGNFWNWIAWGNYTQVKTSEGNNALIRNSTKNLEHTQPRTVQEEKALVEAKAAMAAAKAKEEKKASIRRRRHSDTWSGPPLRRSVTLSTFFHRPGAHGHDLEKGEGGIHGVTPHHGAAAPIRSAMKHPKESRPMESTAGETRDTTPASPRRHRSFEPLPRGIRSRSTSQEGKRSKERHSGQDLADSSENRVQILKKGDHYTVAEIPSFESLQRKENQGQKRDFEGPLDVELLPRTNVIRYNTTAPAGLGITKKSSIKTPERTARRSSESHTREVLLSNLRGDPYLGQDGPRGPHGSDSTAVGHPSDLVRHVSYGSSRGGGDEKSETGSIDSKDDQDGYRSKGGKHRSKPKGGMLAVFGHRSSSEDSSDSMTRSGRKVTLAGEYSQPAPPPPPAPRTIFINVPKPKTLRYRIWEGLQKLKSEEVQFGFKMAVAMTFIGLWSWLNITSETFATDRGQWAMLTVIAVLSPTVGATFSVCAFRILGTILGTLWALLTYLALPRDPYVICAMMLVISFICVFLILEAGHPKLGIVTLLSYTSTTLLMYEGLTTETIYQVCYKRGVTVILGILISVVLQLLWPILARRELRKEIAILISREGVLFAELVSKFLLEDQPRDQQRHSKLHPYAKLYEEKESDLDDSDEYEDDDDISDQKGKRRYQPKQSGDPSHFRAELGFVEEAEAEELAKRDREQGRRRKEGKGRKQAKGKGSGSDNDDRDDDEEDRYWTVDRFRHQVEDASESSDPDRIAFQHVEHQLQTKLLKISQLLELSIAEPRLKEEFPKKLYGQIIQCCQNILDRLVSMRMAAQLLSPEVRELVTGPMNYYRRDMVGALLLYFSVLSSSLASKSPLPPYLPSARMARLRVIYNVREAIAAHQAATGEDHYTYIYYYAFSSALEEVIEELELLAILIKPLVGVTIVSAGTGNQGFGLTGEQLNIGAAMATSQLGILPMNTEYPPGMGQGYPEMSYGQQHAGLGPSLTGDRSALHGTSVHMTNVGTSQSGRGAGAFGTSANQLNEPVQTPGHPMETVHPYNLHKPIMSRSETAGRIPGVDFHPDLALHHPGILINPAIAPAGQKSVVSDAEPAKRRGSHHHHHDPSESNDSQHSDDGSGSWKSDRHSRHGHRRPQPAHSGEGSSSAPAPEDKMKKKDQSRPRRPSELRIDIPESSMDRAGLASAAAPASSKLIPRKKKMSLDATAAMAASPVIVMDENLLAGHRHAQRYMDAIQVAQEASGQKIVEMPSAMSPISSTAADGSGPGGIKPGITRTPTAPIVPAMIQLPMGASSTESATGGKRPVRERRTSANLIKSVGTGLFARRKSEILGEEEGNGAKMLHGGSKRRSIIRHLGHKSREDLPMAVIVSPPPEDQDLQDQKMEQEWLASSSRVPLKASAGSGSGTGMGTGVGTNTTATRAVGEGHAARSIPPMQSNTISIPAAVVIPFGSEFIPDAPLPLHLIPMQQQQQQASQEQTQTPDDVKHQETH